MRVGRDLDKLFEVGMKHQDIPFNDLDWENLEQRLHPNRKKNRMPLWLGWVAGIAAILIVVFLSKRQNSNNPAQSMSVKVNTNKVKDSTDRSEQNSWRVHDYNLASKVVVPHSKKPNRLAKNPIMNAISNVSLIDGLNQTSINDGILLSDNVNNSLFGALNNNLIQNSIPKLVSFKNEDLISKLAPIKLKTIIKPTFKTKPKWVFSIMAAPDLTHVQLSGKSNLSASLGAELTFFLTKRISLTSGVAYAKKIYDSDFSLYRPNSSYVFEANPTNVRANCDVIDIPLNVNYRLFDKNRYSITVSTGLSSYLMLREKYSYTYSEAYEKPLDYEVKNQNQHYLGIANIGIEFQHKINDDLSISARPFMKIPLTDIGYGNSKLSSTGVAVSLNMNLFRKH